MELNWPGAPGAQSNYEPKITVPKNCPTFFDKIFTAGNFPRITQSGDGAKPRYQVKQYTQEMVNNKKAGDLVAVDDRERREDMTEKDRGGYNIADMFWNGVVEATYPEDPLTQEKPEDHQQEWRHFSMTWTQIWFARERIVSNLFGEGRIKIVYFLFTDSIWKPLKKEIIPGKIDYDNMTRFYELRLAKHIVDVVLEKNSGKLEVKFDIDIGIGAQDRAEVQEAFKPLTDQDRVALDFQDDPQHNFEMIGSNATPDSLVVSLSPTGPIRQILADFDKSLEQRGETSCVLAVICPPLDVETRYDTSSTLTKEYFTKFKETVILSNASGTKDAYKEAAFLPLSIYQLKGPYGLVPS